VKGRRREDENGRIEKSANMSASVESSVANLIASFFTAFCSYLRVCTMEEWRYKLCGMTVARGCRWRRKAFTIREISLAGINLSRCGEAGLRENHFREEAAADGEDQKHDERFDVAKAFVCKYITASTSSAVMHTPAMSGM